MKNWWWKKNDGSIFKIVYYVSVCIKIIPNYVYQYNLQTTVIRSTKKCKLIG